MHVDPTVAAVRASARRKNTIIFFMCVLFG
jgi:hypothetical protein